MFYNIQNIYVIIFKIIYIFFFKTMKTIQYSDLFDDLGKLKPNMYAEASQYLFNAKKEHDNLAILIQQREMSIIKRFEELKKQLETLHNCLKEIDRSVGAYHRDNVWDKSQKNI